MIKKISVSLVVMLLAIQGNSQNWNEWTRQKRTQIRYLVNQIAALQVYIELGQGGYGIYRDGLQLIGDIKDGEFNLHKDYFSSLSIVNASVSGSAEVEEVLSWHEQIQIFRQRINQLDVGNATPSLRRLFAALARKSADDISQLYLLITDGHYQLKDAERIEQIAGVHRQMQKLYSFAKQTYQDAILQSKVSPKQDKEIEIIQRLQGLP